MDLSSDIIFFVMFYDFAISIVILMLDYYNCKKMKSCNFVIYKVVGMNKRHLKNSYGRRNGHVENQNI